MSWENRLSWFIHHLIVVRYEFVGLDSLRSTASIMNLDIYTLILEGTASVKIVIIGPLKNKEDGGVGPIFFQYPVFKKLLSSTAMCPPISTRSD